MSLVAVKTKRFFMCPNPGCRGTKEFDVEHLFEEMLRHKREEYKAGPWYCVSHGHHE